MTTSIRDPERLLPHRAPMLLLDEALDYGEEHAGARVTIHADAPFYDGELGGVAAWVGVEYMAQTIGIWAGGRRLAKDKPIEVGFLLGARSYQSNRELFPLGSELTIRVDLLYNETDGLGSFSCRIDGRTPAGEAIAATARINAFQPEQPQLFVKSADALLATGFPAATDPQPDSED